MKLLSKVTGVVFSIVVGVVVWNSVFSGVVGGSAARPLNIEKWHATAASNLLDCKSALKASGGGWCEMRVPGAMPGISNVWPANISSRVRQVTGPSSILTGWSSAAYDPYDNILYFMGGGHADYGGNEVYSFTLESGVWERLTSPTPLSFFTGSKSSTYYYIPNTRLLPASTHTYDGLIFNKSTRTMMLLLLGAANGAKLTPTPDILAGSSYIPDGGKAAQYEFNPSGKESRNGLPPLTWRRIGQFSWSYPRSVELDNGKLLLGSSTQLFYGSLSRAGVLNVGERFSSQADLGDGNALFDTSRMLVWSIHRKSLLAFDIKGKLTRRIDGLPNVGKSIALDTSGNIVSWDGGTKVYTLDPDEPEPQWQVVDSGVNGPTAGDVGRVYGKWVHVGDDYFVGISSSKHGVWVYREPTDKSASRKLSAVSLQSIINNAKPGSTVTLPQGVYGVGLTINSPITVNMKGVELWGVAGGKAILVIEASGPVTVNDFSTDGERAAAKYGNLAGIRVAGRNFDVTLNNTRIVNTAMGIMTDNRGGRLILNEGFIGNIGTPGGYSALSHVLYAGAIDYLEVNKTVLQNSKRLGHILKSRAKETIVLNSQLLGLDGNHSRVIDFPCGGRLVVEDSVLQSSTRTDNSDMISVGVEAATHCSDGGLPGDVVLRHNKIVFDRGALKTVPEHKQNPNRLFTWKVEVKGLTMEDNIIVYPAGNPVWQSGLDDDDFPDLDAVNKVYRSRGAAGFNDKVNASP